MISIKMLKSYCLSSKIIIVTFILIALSATNGWILSFSGCSYMGLSETYACFYNIPSMSESLCFEGIYPLINWSPSGEFFCGLPIVTSTDTLIGVYRTRTFEPIASGFVCWLDFIHGDTLVCVTPDSINQKIYFLPPPDFSRIVDSVVFSDTVFRELAGVTYDGRFWLFLCEFERPYLFMLYDRSFDSLWFIEDSSNSFYLSKKGFLVAPKQTSLTSGRWRYKIDIINLYHPSDTVSFTDMIGSMPPLAGDLFPHIIAFSNNDSIVYIPFLYSDASDKIGIFIYNIFDRTYIDTVDSEEIYQGSFLGISNMAVTQDGKYAVLSLSYWATAHPYMIADRTILYDLVNHHHIYTIDTICRLPSLSISPIDLNLSKVASLESENNIKSYVSLLNDAILLSCPVKATYKSFSLLDLTGRTVHRWQVEPKNGDKIILPLPEGLPNGIYLLRAGGGKIVGKVVLVR